jgi:hypothetical protein
MRNSVPLVLASLLCSALLASGLRLASAAGEAGAPTKVKLLPPPKFDADVLDKFADDARSKIGPGAPGGTRAVGPQTTAGAAPADGGQVSAAAGSWAKLITPENLESEIKGQIPVLTAAVKTNAEFKSNGRKKAQTAYTELAALFGVVARYDGEVRWKKDALGLEKVFSQAGFNCKTSSDATYKEAQRRSVDLGELVRGGTIELPKVDGETAWSEAVNRPSLMIRMEEARDGENRLGKGTSNKTEFKKNRDALLREAQVLAMISEIIKDPAFESADDASYQGYVVKLQSVMLDMCEAIKGDNQEKAQTLFAEMNKACDSCHGDFK